MPTHMGSSLEASGGLEKGVNSEYGRDYRHGQWS